MRIFIFLISILFSWIGKNCVCRFSIFHFFCTLRFSVSSFSFSSLVYGIVAWKSWLNLFKLYLKLIFYFRFSSFSRISISIPIYPHTIRFLLTISYACQVPKWSERWGESVKKSINLAPRLLPPNWICPQSASPVVRRQNEKLVCQPFRNWSVKLIFFPITLCHPPSAWRSWMAIGGKPPQWLGISMKPMPLLIIYFYFKT